MDFNIYDLLLMAKAQQYDFSKGGRERSNEDVRLAFYAINALIKPEVTYEVGAFEAQFSKTIKEFLPQTRVVAFEANPYNYAEWKSREKTAAIEYLHLAISDHIGESDFFVQRRSHGEPVEAVHGSNSLLLRTDKEVEYEVIKVPTTTLAKYAKQCGLEEKNFTAWIDAEGSSEAVLKGGGDLWKHCSALMIEVEELAYWKDQWLFWEVAEFLMQQDFVPIIRDFEYEHQFNVIFIKKVLLRNPGVRDFLVRYFGES